MSSPKAPAAPDYKGAAEATGASNLANTRLQAELNRPNVLTPLGSQTWTQGPASLDQGGYDAALATWEAANAKAQGGSMFDRVKGAGPRPTEAQFMNPGGYTQNINLSPNQQDILGNEETMSKLMGQLGINQVQGASEMLSTPFDPSTVGGGQQEIQDALYRRSTSMLDPQFEQRDLAERDRLANQGFQTGTAGFDTAMGNFNRDRAFSYGDARDRAIVGGQAARKDAVAEALMARNQPINEINALKSGSQVQMPQFQATPAVGQIPGTDYSGSTAAAGQFAGGLYGNQVAETNAQRQALASMGTMAALYSMMGTAAPVAAAASDRRLKEDIVRIGDDPRGFGIYQFRYLGGDTSYIGVMADEVEKVMPWAVTEVGGYKAVYYGML